MNSKIIFSIPDDSLIIENFIDDLKKLFKEQDEVIQRWKDRLDNVNTRELRDNNKQFYSQYHDELNNLNTKIIEKLQDLLLKPPQHSRHINKLITFHQVADYEKSVFIITKFPEGRTEADCALQRVINAVSKSLKDCGFYPRIATDKEYHSLLWDNVELYLLGCSKGVAIVEDRYKPELNPNLAMEWGWMRGMGKDVLYLVEKTFEHPRADWSGLIEHHFSWEKPEGDIDNAIKKCFL